LAGSLFIEKEDKMAARILVVNDTQEILEVFRQLLEEEGYEVILSSYPIYKSEEIEQLHVDLIVLDLIFGEERSGWQMLQLLKMQRSTASIPVVLCTASERAVREMEGYLVAKNVLVVYKPFEIDDLLKVIKQALESRSL
jgi:CheY-like chemotaxis protein